jgi:hypothetical protein
LQGGEETVDASSEKDPLVIEAEHIHNKVVFDCINEAIAMNKYRKPFNEAGHMEQMVSPCLGATNREWQTKPMRRT